MLTDQFQRRFSYLRLSVTDVCNFRCNYCLPDGYCDEKQPEPLSVDEIHALVSAFAANGTRKVRITGGEPTLRKDLADIIRCCKSVEGINTVAMTSNGYRMNKQIDQYLAAGLDSLNLSADSLRPEIFQLITGHDKLQQVLDTVDIAIKLGISSLKLNAVLLRQYNWQERQQFFDYVKNRPISLRFIELMKTGDNGAYFDQQHVRGSSLQQQLIDDDWVPVLKGADAGPAIEYAHPQYQGKIGLIMPYSKDFCASCNRLRVSSQGKLHLCLFADDNMDLRPYLLTESTQQLAQRIQHLVHQKLAGHELESGFSGATRHLAMLGG